jgi:hypothetical protein
MLGKTIDGSSRGEKFAVTESNGFSQMGRVLSEHKLSRARFLRLLATGLGLSFIPSSLALWGGGSALGASAPTLLADGRFPIGLWSPPPPAQTTLERYQQIAAAGFDFVIGGNGIANDSTNPGALEASAANNLRFLLTDSKLRRIIRDSTAATSTSARQTQEKSLMQLLLTRGDSRATSPTTADTTSTDPQEQVRLRVERLIQLYGGHPALSGLNLYDEPSRAMFGIVGYAGEVLQGSAPEQLPYVNVWPSYASLSALGTSTYEEYLRLYLDEVNPPLLCFDHYPLLSGTDITSDFFYNWAIVRRFALEAGIPAWVFIQSVDFWGDIRERRRPNEAEIRWQINVSLAYGAKGLQYFTYWTPTVASDAPIQFGESLVSRVGVLTPLYDYAKRANAYLKVVGKVLLPLTSERVVHANETPLPRGASAFEADGYVTSVSGSPVILSKFRDPAGGTDRYLLVANRSFANAAETRLTLSGSVSEVYKLDTQTGTFARVTQKGSVLVKVAPGRARLYLLKPS